MNDHSSSVRALSIRARELGRRLRGVQEQSGMNGKTLARRLGWSETRLSRALSGRVSSRDLDVSAFLGACGVTGDARSHILRLCRPDVDGNLLRLPVSQAWDAHLAHAVDAASVSEHQPAVIPWAAQTSNYTRSVLTSGWPDVHDSVDMHVAARRCAKSMLERSSVGLLLDEWALRNPVGDSRVMSDQLHHLLRLSVRTNLSIRVVPTGTLAPSCVGGFTVLTFSDYDTFVYTEDLTAGLFTGEIRDLDAYHARLRCLESACIDEHLTRGLISAIAADFAAAADRSPNPQQTTRSSTMMIGYQLSDDPRSDRTCSGDARSLVSESQYRGAHAR